MQPNLSSNFIGIGSLQDTPFGHLFTYYRHRYQPTTR
jgi:hypothetical protein